MQCEAPFAPPWNYPEALQIGLASSLCNGATGMLQCTVYPELTYTPLPPNSISQLTLAKNILRPQITLVLSTGEANLGAHNFSNQVSPSSVMKAETEAIRLLGQNMRCIQLPMETVSTSMETGSAVLAGLLDYASLEVGHKILYLSHLCIIS